MPSPELHDLTYHIWSGKALSFEYKMIPVPASFLCRGGFHQSSSGAPGMESRGGGAGGEQHTIANTSIATSLAISACVSRGDVIYLSAACD